MFKLPPKRFDVTQTKCVNSLNGFRVYNDGTAMFCCMSRELLTDKNGELANIKTVPLDSIIHGKKAVEIREALQQGIRHKNCERCWNEEDAGLTSKRIRDNHEFPIKDITNTDIRMIELNLGTTCNLKCRICSPWSSSQWNKEFLQIGQWTGSQEKYKKILHNLNHSYDDDSLFWEEFRNRLPTVEKIDIYGGEPFLVKKQWEMLQYSIDQGYSKNQTLHFNTNGTQFDDEKARIINGFKKAYISLSLDGIGKQFEYQRHPAKWDEVLHNLTQFKEYGDTFDWHISICITVNMYNIFYLDTIIKFFETFGVTYYLNFLHDPPRYNITNIPLKIKKKIIKRYQSISLSSTSRMWINKAIEYMNLKKPGSSHWVSFLEVTDKLDTIRNEQFKDVFPEFYDLITEKNYAWTYENLKYLHIELTNHCNAACPMCPRFIRNSEIIDPTLILSQITLDKFKEFFPKEILQNIERVTFCGTHGDPMAAKDIIPIIRYLLEVNPEMGITANTNGGLRSTDFWIELGEVLKNTVHEITFSIDGLEDTNHIYRRHVSWDKVINNATAFISQGGIAYWDFLIFKHNEHQIDQAKNLSQHMGFKKFFSKRALGFSTVNGQNRPRDVYDKDGNFVYWLEPPFEERFINLNGELIDGYREDKVIVEHMLNYRNNMTLDDVDEKYEPYLNKKINCKFLNRDSSNDTELYVNANGIVIPCCFMGSAVAGSFGAEHELQIRKIFEEHKDRLDLNQIPLYDIINSGVLTELFVKKWELEKFSQGKPVFCSMTCGENNHIDRIFVNKK